MGAYYVIDKTNRHTKQCILDEWHSAGSLLTRLIGTEDSLPPSCNGDAFVIRDCLREAGFIWGRDFYIRRRKDGEPE